MTRDRLREIVAAMRSPEGCACSLSEMNAAFLLLADLAGIGSADEDLDGFEARARSADASVDIGGCRGCGRMGRDVFALVALVRRERARADATRER